MFKIVQQKSHYRKPEIQGKIDTDRSFLVLSQRFDIASRPTTPCLIASAGTALACAAKRRTWCPDPYRNQTRTSQQRLP